MDLSSTICAIATGSVSGAVAVVRISGPRAFEVVDAVVKFRKGRALGLSAWSVKYGEVFDGGELLDQVVVSVFPAPNSYTGEDCAELCCHASPYIVSSLLELLCAAGAVVAGPGEFTQRAFVNGKMDLAQAEAVADVIAATSAAQHRLAVNQLRGGYSAEFRSLRDSLLELSALVELELDFSEEDVEFADRSKLRGLALSAVLRCSSLAESFQAGNALKNGIPVAIVGSPNSGKSTLLNALVGESRAIVSDVPGTTRDTVEETMVIGGYEFRFIDTAGIREATDVVEKMGIERSFEAIGKAEVVLEVVDAAGDGIGGDVDVDVDVDVDGDGDGDGGVAADVDGDAAWGVERDMALIRERCEGKKLIVLWNKCDIVGMEVQVGAIELQEQVGTAGMEELRISAKTGAGLEELRSRLTAYAASLAEDNESAVLITNARHAAALRDTATSLQALLAGLDTLPTELLAEELRSSIASLNLILGEDLLTPQTTLNSIFSAFCIGK